MSDHRFFRAADAVYEHVRTTLDAAWSMTPGMTCIEPAATAPRGSDGLLYVAVRTVECDWPPADQMLPMLLGSGQVEEVGEEQYRAALPVPHVYPFTPVPPGTTPRRRR